MTRIGRIGALFALALLTSVNAASAEMLSKGARFPDWALKDHTGKDRSSAEFAGGPYLIWYYPKASTPGCAAEGRGLREAYAELSAAGLDVIGVSFDDLKHNAEFATAEEFPFPLLSDTDRKLAVAIGAADSDKQQHARRISYLVGADGTVLVAYGDVEPKAHAAQVLKDFHAR